MENRRHYDPYASVIIFLYVVIVHESVIFCYIKRLFVTLIVRITVFKARNKPFQLKIRSHLRYLRWALVKKSNIISFKTAIHHLKNIPHSFGIVLLEEILGTIYS